MSVVLTINDTGIWDLQAKSNRTQITVFIPTHGDTVMVIPRCQLATYYDLRLMKAAASGVIPYLVTVLGQKQTKQFPSVIK